MAITVGDAVLKITGDSTGLDKALKDVDGKIATSTANWRKGFMLAGAAMTAFGAAIMAILGASIYTFARTSEQILLMSQRTGLTIKTIQELGYVAKMTGSSIEGLEIAVRRMQVLLAQAATGSEQAAYSLRLIGLTINNLRGLSVDEQFLTIAYAIASIPDPTQRAAMAIEFFGRTGTQILPMMTDDLKDMIGEANSLGAIMSDDMVRSGAKFYTSIEKIKTSINGLKDAIASFLTEDVQRLADDILETVKSLIAWANENRELVRSIGLIALAFGTILSVLGPFLVMLPGALMGISAIAGIFGITMLAATGWVGLAIAAIIALIAIGIALWKNWDKVVDFFTGSQREMTKVMKKELEERTKANKEALETQRKDAVAANTKAKTDLRNHYGVLEGYTKQENKTLMDLARDASKARGKAIDLEMDALEDAHDRKMRMIDEEYEAKIGALDAETNAAIAALEGQLDAMDAEDKATARSEEDQTDTKRLQQIQNAIINARNNFERIRAEKELVAFQTEMADKQKERGRVDKRESLQAQISTLREQAANQKQALQDEHDAKIKQEEELYNAFKTRLTDEKTGLDEALDAELIRLEKERLKHEDVEDKKLEKLNLSLEAQEKALIAFHDREMARLSARANARAAETPTGTTAGRTPASAWQDILNTLKHPFSFQGFEGIIPGIPGTPIPAVVHAGEYIGQGGGNTVNIYNPQVRSDQDITEITRQVSREMYRMQQVRHG